MSVNAVQTAQLTYLSATMQFFLLIAQDVKIFLSLFLECQHLFQMNLSRDVILRNKVFITMKYPMYILFGAPFCLMSAKWTIETIQIVFILCLSLHYIYT